MKDTEWGNGKAAGDSLADASHEHAWSLRSPDLFVYACAVCGATWLIPRRCCNRQARRTPATYYAQHESAPATDPDFSIVLLTKNHLELTRKTVDSLRGAAGNHSIEFVIVDCCSTDGSLRSFRDLARLESVRLVVTHPEEPFVYSRNCNRGAQAARGRFLLFANNDIEVKDPELFAKLARTVSDPRTGVVGTRTDSYPCENELQSGPTLSAERIWSVKPVMGFLWGVRADVFAELGGLDERYCDYGCDEVDFQYRAILRNYRIAIVDSLVHHELHATFGPDVHEGHLRNLERFRLKHGCALLTDGEWYGPFLSHSYPTVSVAIACRNDGRYLPRALESVLGSYLPSDVRLQVVVVNDASVDETAEVIHHYRLRFPHQVNAIQNSTSRGPAAAKNAAMDRCIGDYIALLDADDEYLDTKLWRGWEALEGSGSDFAYHDSLLVHSDGREVRHEVGPWSLARWKDGDFLPTCSWMFRSGVVRFCERYASGEDPEFLRRRWKTLDPVYVPEALCRYHLRPGSLSSRAASRIITGQLKGSSHADVRGCADVLASV